MLTFGPGPVAAIPPSYSLVSQISIHGIRKILNHIVFTSMLTTIRKLE